MENTNLHGDGDVALGLLRKLLAGGSSWGAQYVELDHGTLDLEVTEHGLEPVEVELVERLRGAAPSVDDGPPPTPPKVTLAVYHDGQEHGLVFDRRVVPPFDIAPGEVLVAFIPGVGVQHHNLTPGSYAADPVPFGTTIPDGTVLVGRCPDFLTADGRAGWIG